MQTSEKPEKQSGGSNSLDVKKEILSWVEVIAIAVLAAWFLTQFIIVNATVPSGSMQNTIQPKDRLFGLRLTYYFSSPKRGDIAVFKYPVNEALISQLNDADGKAFLKANDIKHTNYIKRVIGLPGETVEIKDAKIYIDGELLEEDYLKEEWVVRNDGFTFEVPEGCYLMLGDNRNNSSDGRYWAELAYKYFTAAGVDISVEDAISLSFVPEDYMLGKAYVRYWPIWKMTVLH